MPSTDRVESRYRASTAISCNSQQGNPRIERSHRSPDDRCRVTTLVLVYRSFVVENATIGQRHPGVGPNADKPLEVDSLGRYRRSQRGLYPGAVRLLRGISHRESMYGLTVSVPHTDRIGSLTIVWRLGILNDPRETRTKVEYRQFDLRC